MDNHHHRRTPREYRSRKSNLPKRCSLPGLHLVANEQQLFHCKRCGFINTLIPLCLWCTLAHNEAGRELQPSKAPTRRVSSPALLLMHVEARSNQRNKQGSTKRQSAHHDTHNTTSISSYPPSVALAANVLPESLNQIDPRRTAFTSSFSLSDTNRDIGRPLSLESAEAFNDSFRSADNDTPRSRPTISTPPLHVNSLQTLDRRTSMNSEHVDPLHGVITNDTPANVDIPHWSDVTTATSARLGLIEGASVKRYRPTHPPALSYEPDSALAFARARTPQEEVADITTDLSGDLSRSDNALCETSLSKKSSGDRVLKPTAKFPGENHISPHPLLSSCVPLGVDRSLSNSMAITTKNSMRSLKATRRGFMIGFNDHKAESHTHDDNDSTYDEPNVLTPSNSTDSKPSSPVRSLAPRPQPSGSPLRTLRRKKHLRVNVVQAYADDADASEPIAISLTLGAEPTSEHNVSSKATPHVVSSSSLHKATSTISLKNNILAPLVISPMSTIEEPLNSPTPSSLVDDQPSYSPTASNPVKLGHPSRPYYTAIRKNGISPPSSRPSSMSGPSPTSQTRPKSYNPPTSFHMNTALASITTSNTASRHMSMSAAFAPNTSNILSAFSVTDDDAISDDDNYPVTPPALAPARLSLSLSPGRVKRASYEYSATKNSSKSDKRKSGRESMPGASTSLPTHSVGFSMSGQTELRMALAAASGTTENGFRYNFQATARRSGEMERSPVSPSSAGSLASPVSAGGAGYSGGTSPPSAWAAFEGAPPGSRNSFSNRVKKLRKGIKDMLGHSLPSSPC